MQALSIFIYLLSVGFAACDSASLVWNEASNSYSYKAGWVPGAMAYGKLVNAINETGWAMFDVTTNGSYSDTMQAYAAGYLEGYLTRDLIRMHWHNTYDGYCSEPYSSYCQRLQDYLVKNFDWMKLQRDQAEGRDPYWHQVGLFLDQLTGMIDGYTAGQEKKHDHLFDVKGLIMLQISGDLEDLSSALGAPPSQQRPLGSGSCSAIIKVLPDNADLYVSHDTWTEYSTMLRILKKYSFNFHVQKGGDELIKGNTVTFSSYPGSLLSGDDFYVISSGLVTQETTIGNSNAALWAKVKPTDSVLECIRNVVANRLAQTGDEWTSLFSRHNSGTYNNQWMIVDYKLFKPRSALPDTGLLTVVEQIPGLIVSKDQTAFLRQTSYWPSYNVAYYPEVFNLSGGWDNVKKFGDWFTYDKTPRALIFKRDQSNVVDIPSLIKLMRYNDYTKDPYSRCDCTPPYSAENSIAARCDLNPANGTYPFSSLGHRDHGATDMKMTNSTLVTSLQFVGISGPTFDPLPPFQWSTSDYRDTVPHVGHPDLWTFKPVIADWEKKSFRSVY